MEIQSLESVLNLQTTSFASKYTIHFDRKVGNGGKCGNVLRCSHLVSGKEFALKRLPYSRDALEEVQTWTTLTRSPHPNIAGLVEVFDTGILDSRTAVGSMLLCDVGVGQFLPSGRYVFIVMDYYSGGELFDFICEPHTEREVSFVVAQILSALEHMHHLGFTHGDIKAENVVFQDGSGSLHVRLIDFGFARHQSSLRAPGYTPYYVSPEIMECCLLRDESQWKPLRPVGPPSDIWAIGVLTYMIMTHLPPFFSSQRYLGGFPSDFQERVRTGNFARSSFFYSCSPAAQDFIERMLVVDEERRPTSIVAQAHPWLKGAQVLDQPMQAMLETSANVEALASVHYHVDV